MLGEQVIIQNNNTKFMNMYLRYNFSIVYISAIEIYIAKSIYLP